MPLTKLNSWVALLALAPMSAFAQAGPSQDGLSVGLITTLGTSPYVEEDTSAGVLPLVTYRQGPFSIGFQGLTYEAYRAEPLSLSFGITPRITGLEDPDSDALDGIDRSITADAFLALGYALGGGMSVETTLRQEVTGEHDGQELQVELGYATRFGRTGASVGAGAKWQSEDLANYVWGVTPGEAIAGRPAYEAGDVIIPYLTAGAVRPLSQNLALIGNINAEFLPDDVTDSPIVEDSTPVSVLIGLSYMF